MPDEPSNREDLWGPVNRDVWRETPCIVGRAANEQDVRDGRAVFYVDGPAGPVEVALPHCALFRQENGQKLPVIAIQAESHVAGQVLIGYRPLSGGNGICMPGSCSVSDSPDPLADINRLRGVVLCGIKQLCVSSHASRRQYNWRSSFLPHSS